MAEQEKERQLDQLLDSLLAQYSQAEPRPGMQTRLRAILRAEILTPVKRERWHVRWLLAGAGAAALAAVMFALYVSRVPPVAKPPVIPVAGVPVLPPTRPVTVPNKNPQRQKSRVEPPQVASKADMRQEVFPTPNPLSEQERLLLRYLAGTPGEEVATHAREDEPPEKGGPLVPESQRISGAEVFGTR